MIDDFSFVVESKHAGRMGSAYQDLGYIYIAQPHLGIYLKK
jgi:hypothetical protein